MPGDWTAAIDAKIDHERETGEPADPEEYFGLRQAQARQHLETLDNADRALFLFARSRPRPLPLTELARQMGVARSTLYERLARIDKELARRVCHCGCGEALPRKSTRRRRYLNDQHRTRARLRRLRGS